MCTLNMSRTANDALEERRRDASANGEDMYHWSDEMKKDDDEDDDINDEELMRLLEEVHGPSSTGSSQMTGTGTLDEDERRRHMMRYRSIFQRMFMGGNGADFDANNI